MAKRRDKQLQKKIVSGTATDDERLELSWIIRQRASKAMSEHFALYRQAAELAESSQLIQRERHLEQMSAHPQLAADYEKAHDVTGVRRRFLKLRARARETRARSTVLRQQADSIAATISG